MSDHADAWWAGWTGLVVVIFLALEIWALRSRVADKPSGTLTATLRRWLGISPKRWWAPIGVALFTGGLIALASHILVGVP